MILPRLALTLALTFVWSALPPLARANEGDGDGEETTVEVRKHVRHADRDGGDERDDEREGGRRERPEGMGGREGRGGGPHGMDPEMKEKFSKMRELERKLHDLAKGLRSGTDAEKAAAKTEARKVLGDLFDAKLALETAMLEKMEKHAAELKAKIAKKKGSREKAIDSRLARMSGEGDDWD